MIYIVCYLLCQKYLVYYLFMEYLENLPHCKASTSSSSRGLSLIKHSPWSGCPRCSICIRSRIGIHIRWAIFIVQRCHSRNVCLSYAAGQLTFNYPTVDWVLPCPLIKWSIEQSISCCRCLNRCIVLQLHQSCGQWQRGRERERETYCSDHLAAGPLTFTAFTGVQSWEWRQSICCASLIQFWNKLQSALHWFTKIRAYTIKWGAPLIRFE